MRYLLDTQVLIWYFEKNSKLSKKIEGLIDNPENFKSISIATLWEIVIKLNINKLEIDLDFCQLIDKIKEKDLEILPVTEKYLKTYLTLPLLHGDPFDRLIISTAISERLTLISSDNQMQLYDVDWVWKR